jgi:putative copper resistance protein D
MAFPIRALYLLVQVPVNSFLGMAFVFAPAPLYAHYANLGSPYGIDALADQQAAGGIMWLAGDVVFIAGILGIIAAWMRHEQRDEPAAERRFEVERIALRERADRLARTKADRP